MAGAAGDHKQMPGAVRVGKPGVERVEDDAAGVEQTARRGRAGGHSRDYLDFVNRRAARQWTFRAPRLWRRRQALLAASFTSCVMSPTAACASPRIF